jgi:hypothetical protein
MRFLEDALRRDVLRTIGPVYQFRHARLQDRLAGPKSADAKDRASERRIRTDEAIAKRRTQGG